MAEIINVSVRSIDDLDRVIQETVEQVVQGVLDDMNSLPLSREMETIEDKLHQHHQQKFDTQMTSEGASWAKLKPATIRAKGNDRILIDTTALRESEAGRNQFSIRDVEIDTSSRTATLVFGTRREAATVHQLGSKTIPARPHIGISDQLVDNITEQIADNTVTEAKKGKARRP